MEINKLFKSRYNLHHDVYQHSTNHAYELMICDVLFLINKVPGFYDFEKVINDPDQYLELDDSIIDEVHCSQSTDLKILKAKQIITRIQCRQHYKCVGEKGLNAKRAKGLWSEISEEAVVKCQGPSHGKDVLKVEDVAVKKFKINYGLGGEHPLSKTKFFDKKGLQNPYFLNQKKIESMLPTEIMVWTVRCYVRPNCEKKFLQCQQAFENYCTQNLGGTSRQIHKEQS